MINNVRLFDVDKYYLGENVDTRRVGAVDQVISISIYRDGAIRCKVMKDVDVDMVGDCIGDAGHLCGVIIETIAGNRGDDDHEQ